MLLGYIQSRDGVAWTGKKRLHSRFSTIGKNATDLANGVAPYSGTVYAHKCDECKKVIIDYVNQKDE